MEGRTRKKTRITRREGSANPSPHKRTKKPAAACYRSENKKRERTRRLLADKGKKKFARAVRGGRKNEITSAQSGRDEPPHLREGKGRARGFFRLPERRKGGLVVSFCRERESRVSPITFTWDEKGPASEGGGTHHAHKAGSSCLRGGHPNVPSAHPRGKKGGGGRRALMLERKKGMIPPLRWERPLGVVSWQGDAGGAFLYVPQERRRKADRGTWFRKERRLG